MTNFYLYLWGMLEHLTLIAKFVRGLEVNERSCGIDSPRCWEVFGKTDPPLRAYIRERPIREWITAMADARHAPAHRAMLLPNEIVTETEDSKKTEVVSLILWEISMAHSSG